MEMYNIVRTGRIHNRIIGLVKFLLDLHVIGTYCTYSPINKLPPLFDPQVHAQVFLSHLQALTPTT